MRANHTSLQSPGQSHGQLADDEGGHFYNADYGVRIQGGPDTVVAWDPEHWHGTSLKIIHQQLQVISTLNQTGLSIFTPERLPGIWKNMMSSS